ncbi:MAG: FlgD immunoglobulin-like domain containing protein [Candidatus Eisenbacteria bacterium]
MFRRFALAASVCALLSAAAATPSHANWSRDVRVNTPVCTATGDQWAPVSAPDGAGGFLVAWYDWRSGNADVYVQRYDGAGRALWTAGGVLACGATGDQTNVHLVADGTGGALLAWQDDRGSATKVLAQRVSAQGVPLWATDGISMGTVLISVVQTNPELVQTGSGSCAIAFEQSGNIYAQRITSAGALAFGSSPLLVCGATGTQAMPRVAYEATPAAPMFYVTWEDPRSGNLDVYAQRLSMTGAVQWAANGLAICTATGDQDRASVHWDRGAGMFFSWTDRRSGNRDVYAQRVTTAGVVQWAANGVVVCADASEQWAPTLVTGGSGKIIVGWEDWRDGAGDPYAQLLNSSGVAQWTANGAPLCQASGHQTNPDWTADGNGGVIAAWEDQRDAVGYHVYAQRLDATGTRLWGTNGVAVCLAAAPQLQVTVAANGTPLTFVAWRDLRTQDVHSNIYAQAIDAYGLPGGEPVLELVRDVSGDQGGKVAVRWSNAAADAYPSYAVDKYLVYGKAPAATTWTLRDSLWAAGLPGYEYLASTTVDSTAAGNPRTAFYVVAREYGGARTWSTLADSGYSVDNLLPPVPFQFSALWESGVTRLSWGASDAPDLAGYRIWRGETATFTPGDETFVADVQDTRWSAVNAPPGWYRVAALDVHGNAAPTAAIAPAGIAGIGEEAARDGVVFAAPSPSPLRTTSVLRFALPHDARVRLAVHDAQGRLLRTLADGEYAAGEHVIRWDGCDARGRAVASALYFVRLETGGRAFTRRLVVVR